MGKLLAASISFLIILCCLIIPDQNSAAQEGIFATFNNLEMKIIKSMWQGLYLSTGQSYQLMKSQGDRNRSYSFFASGLLMVFVGTHDYDRNSNSTGSRTYHLLPFKEKRDPSFNREDESTVEALLPSGHTARLSAETGDLVGIEGYTVTTTPIGHFDSMVKSSGSVEIRPLKGYLLIDYGWRTGEMSIGLLWRPAVIYDGAGNRCSIKNSDVLTRDPRDSDEVIFKFKNNDGLDRFLKNKCPKLVWQ